MPVRPVLLNKPFGDAVFTTEDEVLGLTNCTGIVASYCPNCGECTGCERDQVDGSLIVSAFCPLHGSIKSSGHPLCDVYDEPHILKSREITPMRERRPRPTAPDEAFNNLFADENREHRIKQLHEHMKHVDDGHWTHIDFTEEYLHDLPLSEVHVLSDTGSVMEITKVGDITRVFRYIGKRPARPIPFAGRG